MSVTLLRVMLVVGVVVVSRVFHVTHQCPPESIPPAPIIPTNASFLLIILRAEREIMHERGKSFYRFIHPSAAAVAVIRHCHQG